MESNESGRFRGDLDVNNASDERTARRVMTVSRGTFGVY